MVSGNKRAYVVTPNVDHVVKIERDPKFLRVYQQASLVVADGMPLLWAAKLLGTPIKEKISGSDIFPELCKLAADHQYKVFFLGGQEGVAEKAKNALLLKYPDLEVVGVYSPPFNFEKDEKENQRILDMINAARPQFLFVGLGAPKQEKWLYKHINHLHINVGFAVGASFDFVAGTKIRAPKLVQKIGMEWFWRMMQEPRRMFKRYIIDDSYFAYILFRQWKQRKDNRHKTLN